MDTPGINIKANWLGTVSCFPEIFLSLKVISFNLSVCNKINGDNNKNPYSKIYNYNVIFILACGKYVLDMWFTLDFFHLENTSLMLSLL